MIGTPAERYLIDRGCALPTGEDVRYEPEAWHWKAKVHAPAIMSRVTDFVTGEPLTVHLTFITEDGQKSHLEPRKLMLPGHQKQGGVIRLTDDADVTLCLGLAEGVETALTIARTGWGPVWSAIDAGNLAGLPVVPGIECLTVFADNDPAGIKAAETLCQRWFDAGREARIALAPSGDWNDYAQA
jgi:phage/plasmid primase-like uncharacterized protein